MMSRRKDRFIILSVSFCKIKSNQIIFNKLKGALAKNGSLAFACGLACAVRAKANEAFVRWEKTKIQKRRLLGRLSDGSFAPLLYVYFFRSLLLRRLLGLQVTVSGFALVGF